MNFPKTKPFNRAPTLGTIATMIDVFFEVYLVDKNSRQLTTVPVNNCGPEIKKGIAKAKIGKTLSNENNSALPITTVFSIIISVYHLGKFLFHLLKFFFCNFAFDITSF